MPVDLAEHPADLESADGALQEFRTAHDEFANFFGDVFDELQSLSLELFARHECLEQGTRQPLHGQTAVADCRRQFLQYMEELRRVQAEIMADRQETRHARDAIDAIQRNVVQEHAELRKSREEIGRIATEFAKLRDEVGRERAELRQWYQTAESHLARLIAVSTELTKTR